MASYDEVKLEDILHGTFATFNPNTGANKNADSLPTIVVYEETASSPMSTGSVTNMTTGRYRWQVSVAAASGFEQGKFYDVWVSGSVTGTDTVTQATPIMAFKATSSVVDDLALASTALSTGVWTATKAGYLDDAITSRMATYTQPDGFLSATFPLLVAESGSSLDASGVRDAVGLSSANLDTQLSNIQSSADTLPTMPSGWVTSSGIADNALDGKGDWNTVSPPSAASISTQVNSDLSAAHGAGSYITATGFSTHSAADVLTTFGTGSSLTYLAPASTALSTGVWTSTKAGYLDDAITSRMATYTQPVGFLAATFPTYVAESGENLTATGISSQVMSDMSVAHGTGSYLTAVGFSTHSAADVLTTFGTGSTLTYLAPASTALSTGVWTATKAGYLDDTISSRMATYTQPVGFLSATFPAYVAESGSSLDASGIRDAIGLASANLDTQLGDIPTVSEFNNRTIPSGDYFDPTVDAVANVTLVDTLTTYTGNTPQTGDVYPLATGANGFAAIKVDTGDLYTNQNNWVTATGVSLTTAGQQSLIESMFTYDATATYGTAGSLVNEIADNAGGSALTVGSIATGVWEEILANHTGVTGSAAEALSAAGTAGDPWLTPLPGAYGAGTAGKIIGDNIDITISSRMESYTQPTGFLTATFPSIVAESGGAGLDAAGVRDAIGMANPDLDTQLGALAVANNAGDLTSKTADSGVVITGSVISGTYANTASDDDVYWTTAPVTPAVSGYGLRQTLVFNMPLNRFSTQLEIRGWFNGSSNSVDVFAYNTRSLLYDRLTNSSTNLLSRNNELSYSIPIPRDYVDSSGGVYNIVTIELRSTSTNTTHRLYIDRSLIYHVNEQATFTTTSPTINEIWTAPSRTLTTLGSEPVTIPTVSEIASGVWEESLTSHSGVGGGAAEALSLIPNTVEFEARTIPSASAIKLGLSAGSMVVGYVDTVTNTHTSTTTEFDGSGITEATADHYNGRVLIFTNNELTSQATKITDYSNVGGIGRFTVIALTEAPSVGSQFIIV